MPSDPVEFTRCVGSKGQERCGNRVQIEDENASSINSNNPFPVEIKSPIETNGGIPVNIQDQTTAPFNDYVLRSIGSPKTLTSATVVDSYDINVSAGHGFVVNDFVFIADNTRNFYAEVLGVAVNTLTLDSPLDYAFQVADTVVLEVSNNLAVNGAITPVTYTAGIPATGLISLDVTRIIVHIISATEPDDSKFGDLGALTNGVVFRRVGVSGQGNFFNAKTNGRLLDRAGNVTYSDKAGGGKYGSLFVFDIRNDLGVALRIVPGDYLEAIVQDNLTGLEDFHIVIQGHVVTD